MTTTPRWGLHMQGHFDDKVLVRFASPIAPLGIWMALLDPPPAPAPPGQHTAAASHPQAHTAMAGMPQPAQQQQQQQDPFDARLSDAALVNRLFLCGR